MRINLVWNLILFLPGQYFARKDRDDTEIDHWALQWGLIPIEMRSVRNDEVVPMGDAGTKEEQPKVSRPRRPPAKVPILGRQHEPPKQSITESSDLGTTIGMLSADLTATSESAATSEPTISLVAPTPPKDIPKKPSYIEFCQAIDSYSASNIGGHPPKPSKKVYRWYQDIIARTMSIEEQVMFLANIVWETGGLVHKEEIACRDGSCEYGEYFGRGYIQLTWDYNYRDASYALFGNDILLKKPQLVTREDVAWKTANYYWQRHVSPVLYSNNALETFEFGYTVMAINGQVECTGRSPSAIERLRIYNEILLRWNISDSKPGKMTGCYIDPYYFKANGFDIDIDETTTMTEDMGFYETSTSVKMATPTPVNIDGWIETNIKRFDS